jgi:GTP-binding protein
VVQLIDARHDPTVLDRQMLEFLAEVGIPTIIALTKVDKLRARKRATRLSATAAQLELDEEQIVPFSSVTGEGRDELAAAIVALVQQPGWREQ